MSALLLLSHHSFVDSSRLIHFSIHIFEISYCRNIRTSDSVGPPRRETISRDRRRKLALFLIVFPDEFDDSRSQSHTRIVQILFTPRNITRISTASLSKWNGRRSADVGQERESEREREQGDSRSIRRCLRNLVLVPSIESSIPTNDRPTRLEQRLQLRDLLPKLLLGVRPSSTNGLLGILDLVHPVEVAIRPRGGIAQRVSIQHRI
jgi:hypothetical protein